MKRHTTKLVKCYSINASPYHRITPVKCDIAPNQSEKLVHRTADTADADTADTASTASTADAGTAHTANAGTAHADTAGLQ